MADLGQKLAQERRQKKREDRRRMLSELEERRRVRQAKLARGELATTDLTDDELGTALQQIWDD